VVLLLLALALAAHYLASGCSSTPRTCSRGRRLAALHGVGAAIDPALMIGVSLPRAAQLPLIGLALLAREPAIVNLAPPNPYNTASLLAVAARPVSQFQRPHARRRDRSGRSPRCSYLVLLARESRKREAVARRLI